MAVSLVALAILNGPGGPSLLTRLTSMDGDYYRAIVELGYPSTIEQVGDRLANGAGRYAFSPLYPALVSGVRVLGFSARWSQVIVAAVTGIAASVGVHLLAKEVIGSRRAGYVACALLGALPMAVALQMGYAESLAIALGAFALLNVVRHNWWWAAGLALFAGLARPAGGVVALAILVAARGSRRSVPPTLLGLAGLPLYWLYIWLRTGVVDGWFVVQRVGWGTRFDFGQATLDFLSRNAGYENGVMFWLTVATIAGYLAACLVAARQRVSRALLAASVVAVVLVLGSSNFWYSKPRLLLAAFPLVVALARPLARCRTPIVVAVVTGAVATSAWWGAYGITRWPHTI